MMSTCVAAFVIVFARSDFVICAVIFEWLLRWKQVEGGFLCMLFFTLFCLLAFSVMWLMKSAPPPPRPLGAIGCIQIGEYKGGHQLPM